MKIAYIFAGHSRTWKECYHNFFNNIFSVAPGDIFIHTWDKVNCKTGSYWNGWKNVNKELLELSSEPVETELIYQMYEPKVMIIEHDKTWDDVQHEWAELKYKNHFLIDHIQAKARFGVKNVLYQSKKALESALNYSNYDRLFCTRLDINYISKLNPEELHNSDLTVSCTQYSNRFVQDIFFHGTPEQTKIRSDFYNHIDTYWYDGDFVSIEYEEALTKYLSDKNVKTKKSNLKFNIPRINGRVDTFKCI